MDPISLIHHLILILPQDMVSSVTLNTLTFVRILLVYSRNMMTLNFPLVSLSLILGLFGFFC